MASSTNITPVATLQASVNNDSTVTVPAGVTPSHLGIAVFVSANIYSTGSVPSIAGWAQRLSNPSVANNMEWTVLTRLGGHNAGDTITITQNKVTQFDLYMIWYDTTGLDINQIGPAAGRGTSNSQFTAITGLTANSAGQTCIVIATERSTAAGTGITSWSGIYTPGADNFGESSTNVFSSNFFGHFLINSSTSTGTLTANYNTASGNGVGVQMTLGIPTTGSFQDPFTTGSWNAAGTPPGNWWSGYSDTDAPMGGGEWKLPLTTDYMWYYPFGQSFLFNMSTMSIQVRMDAIGNETFSMRLTNDGIPEKGNSFVSVGISTGGCLYMNQRTSDGTDDVYRSSVTVVANRPIVLRLRHGGGNVVYGDYSYDYVNWTTFASKNVTCFNPTTDPVRPMFQAGSPTDELTNFAHISNMNTGRFTPYNAPWRATTQWTYWDGTKEVEVPPGSGFSLEGTWYVGPRVRSLSTGEIATGATVTVNKPASVKTGEYLIAAIAQRDGTANVPTPAGWTFVSGYNSGGPAGVSVGLFYKLATASEPSSYTFSVVGNAPASAHVLRVSNANGPDAAGDQLAMNGTNSYYFPTNTAGPTLPGDLAINVVALSGPTDMPNYPSTDTLVANTTGTGLRLVVTAEQRKAAGILGARSWTLPSSANSVAVGVRSYFMGNGTIL